MGGRGCHMRSTIKDKEEIKYILSSGQGRARGCVRRGKRLTASKDGPVPEQKLKAKPYYSSQLTLLRPGGGRKERRGGEERNKCIFHQPVYNS